MRYFYSNKFVEDQYKHHINVNKHIIFSTYDLHDTNNAVTAD